jgi:4-carboxymuconolactone decarboxylase
LAQVNPEHLDAEQTRAYEAIRKGARGGDVTALFLTMLNSPGLTGTVEQVGAYLRFQSGLSDQLRELGILTVARHWRCGYEWQAHFPLAVAAGLSPEALTRLGRGEDPQWTEGGPEQIIHAYCAAVVQHSRADDALYARCHQLLGDRGIADLTGLVGYYTLLAMTLNGHDVAAPSGAVAPWVSAPS